MPRLQQLAIRARGAVIEAQIPRADLHGPAFFTREFQNRAAGACGHAAPSSKAIVGETMG
jgi:hypothetical protein